MSDGLRDVMAAVYRLQRGLPEIAARMRGAGRGIGRAAPAVLRAIAPLQRAASTPDPHDPDGTT